LRDEERDRIVLGFGIRCLSIWPTRRIREYKRRLFHERPIRGHVELAGCELRRIRGRLVEPSVIAKYDVALKGTVCTTVTPACLFVSS
jgi:hypothetical protein